MSKAAKISIIAGVIILFVVLLYFFGGKRQEEDTFISDNWSETYDPSDKGPYGTYVMKELLDTAGLFGNFIQLRVDLKESLEDDPNINDIYFFVGGTNHLPDSSAEYLMEFVEAGNTAFISTRNLPKHIKNELFYEEYDIYEIVRDSSQFFKFTHPDLKSGRYEFNYIYNNHLEERSWQFFQEANFNRTYYEEPIFLGSNTKDQWNYVKIKHGKGFIYLHSNPYCFTNVAMLRRNGFIYAERVLEHLPPGRVQWDRYNLNYHYSSSQGDQEGGGEERRSMLEFIMANPPLIWAFFILLSGAILYALFKGKRRQKIIPAAELKENTSLEYVNTLSSLYMQQGSHSKLIQLKKKTFFNFIAERYYIQTKKADNKYIEKVAVKAQIDKEKIQDIFENFDRLEGAVEVSDDQLIHLHQKIEYFYKNCS
ncbi:MAG: hypothetical protein WDZ35_01400 [Crocinitomicaceae bacterium]